MTITPATGLRNAQAVQIFARGFKPHQQLLVVQCADRGKVSDRATNGNMSPHQQRDRFVVARVRATSDVTRMQLSRAILGRAQLIVDQFRRPRCISCG